MRRYFSILLILLSLPLASRAQERDWGSVSGSFESNSILYMELSTDAEKAADFIAGVIPADLKKEFEEAQKTNPDLKVLTNK